MKKGKLAFRRVCPNTEPEEAFWMISSGKQEENKDEADDDSGVNI